jgi:hypothetical protein
MKRWWARKTETPQRRASQSVNPYSRNRTISSYVPASANPELARISAHELRRHRRGLIRVLLFSLVVVGVLGLLISQLTANISAISYAPATIVRPDEAAIRQTVNDYYASRPLERLRFLLNRQTLGQYLANKLPEIKDVQAVAADGLGQTRLSLDMRSPIASWRVDNQTLYVDASGTTFTHNYYSQPSVEVDDRSGTSSLGSSAIASSSMIRYIGQLISLLQSNGVGTVQKVVLPVGMIRELDVYLQGRAYYIKVQLDRDVASQAADVKAAVTYIDAHGGAQKYVDVRVQGKAFYR